MKPVSILLSLLCSFIVVPLSAQVGNCDAVQILDVKLNPFNPEQIMVRSAYDDFDNFISYPTFSLVNEDQFILAMETLNFFGMSIEQIHQLDIVDLPIEPGVVIPATLELWSFDYEFLECTFEDDFLLWPDQECVPLTMTINLTAEDTLSFAGTMNWSISNSSGEVIESAITELDSAATLTNWQLCLPEGCDYEMNVELTGFAGMAVSYSLHYNSALAIGPAGWLLEDGMVNHPFNLYTCVPTNIRNAEFKNLKLFPNPSGDTVSIRFPESETNYGTVEVYDQQGRMIKKVSHHQSEEIFMLDVSDLPAGVYPITIWSKDGKTFHERVVVTH